MHVIYQPGFGFCNHGKGLKLCICEMEEENDLA